MEHKILPLTYQADRSEFHVEQSKTAARERLARYSVTCNEASLEMILGDLNTLVEIVRRCIADDLIVDIPSVARFVVLKMGEVIILEPMGGLNRHLLTDLHTLAGGELSEYSDAEKKRLTAIIEQLNDGGKKIQEFRVQLTLLMVSLHATFNNFSVNDLDAFTLALVTDATS